MTDYRQASAHPSGIAADRTELLEVLTAALDATGDRWAWQGEPAAPQAWAADSGAKDLDLWYAGRSNPLAALTSRYACARVAEAHDPRRLRHISLAVLTETGPAVVDLTYGDLCVGPVLLVPATEATTDPGPHRLTGVAAMADLLIRPVLRGRIPGLERLEAARAAWTTADPDHREALARRLTHQLGARVTADLLALAGGAAPDPRLLVRARLRLAARSLAPDVLPATWAQRRSVLPAAGSAGPLGLRTRGVVVALVGTDGSGKSTVASALTDRLTGIGWGTGSAYFGMARGNLPGVALARRMLGVGSTTPPRAAATGSRPAPDHPGLRKAAAWFYAGEYVWRYLSTVAPAVARRRVVIADRWVYDLRESPWPGSPAARVVERLVPAPDVLVLPDAPIDLIHRRKPERSRAEQEAQQQRYRRLLDERPARHAELTVDTSGEPGRSFAALVAAVLQAAHAPRRRRRPR
ncbi:thymidylate kinase-like protein [Actinoplanes sp. N902-109]|uniref:thymidylate kinase-like protein n=1 Tax=Actinoplanes sp. (strain N902-109) TaxID=649831 RepID=UPI0003294BF3|nr:thymidylate kinase-like protein [Actinoplanes sp. N902-109]AGL14308.1 thymidylate kinase-like protein [Actinoplanes sp. N902-109]